MTPKLTGTDVPRGTLKRLAGRTRPAWSGFFLCLLALMAPRFARADVGAIEGIQVQGLRRMTSEAFNHALGIRVGDPYDVSRIRAQYRRLWDLGLFSEITIEAEDGPEGGKVLVVKVVERPVLTSITYEDNKVITRTNIEDRLKERKVELEVGKPLNLKSVFEAESVIRDLLGEKGYLDAGVGHKVSEVTQTTSAVSFSIAPGGKTRVRKIEFVGNSIYSDHKLKRELKLTRAWRWYWPGSGKSLYHPAKWDQDAGSVRELYLNTGYLDAKVEAPVVELKEIVKTRRTKDRQGNRLTETPARAAPTVEPPPVLKKDAGLEETRPSTSEARRRADKQRRKSEKEQKKLEKERRKAEPKVRRWAYLTVPVSEGPQYRLGAVSVTGNSVLDEKQVRAMIPIRDGQVLNLGLIEHFALKEIKRQYQNRGYAYATALPEIERHEGEPIADVKIIVTEDKQYHIARVEFSGNTATQDRVLRREFRLNEGDLFNKTLLDTSINKINQLGYFEVRPEDVLTEPIEGESRVRVTVPGEEKGRNEIQVGGGYSGQDGAFFQGAYSTRNLLGRGQVLSTSIQVGGRANRYQVSFQEPWFLNRPYTLGFSLFRRDLAFGGNLRSSGKGGGVILGRQLGYYKSLLLSYDYENLSSSGFSLNGTVATNRISSLTPIFQLNKIDNPYRPARGFSIAADVQVAGGPLGGDTSYLKPRLTHSSYRRLWGRSILGFHGEAGLIRSWQGGGSDNTSNVFGVPRLQRFWLGGDTAGPRVFETRSISPLRFVRLDAFGRIVEVTRNPIGRPDTDFDRNGDHVIDRRDLVEMGGDRFFLAQSEFIVAVSQQIEFALFVDVGNTLFEDTSWGFKDVRASAGAEVRFYLPVFPVPLRLIYGVPLRELPEDRTSSFTFSIGRSF